MFVDVLDSFHYLDKNSLSTYWLIPLFLTGLVVVIITRRPVRRIKYKHPTQDLTIEVRIGDLFSISGQKIISTNTTFDTDIANGIISINSLQGQFTQRYFPGELAKLDAEIDAQIKSLPHKIVEKVAGKIKKYAFGTTVKIKLVDQYFYWVAMSDLNASNNAVTKLKYVKQALEGLWDYVIDKGEKLDTVIPVMGSGLGRLPMKSKNLIAVIAESFIAASEDQIFSNKLTIVVHPADVEKSGLNLFEVRDLLLHYLP
ncbi:DUF6430 domain-containing protein [Mucilaginibacter puniceus]